MKPTIQNNAYQKPKSTEVIQMLLNVISFINAVLLKGHLTRKY